MTNTLPGFVQFTNISQAQFITRHQPHVIVCFRKSEICNPLLVETNIPANDNVILGLQVRNKRIASDLLPKFSFQIINHILQGTLNKNSGRIK